MVLTSPALADCVSDCNIALKKADQVIQDQKQTIDLQDKALKDSRNDVIALQVDLQNRIDRDSSLLRNPWFDGLLGAVVGILVVSTVRK